ncbi:MAG TPA: Fe-S cluster assembly protein SufD [Candidatus Dormibacteraeota bacterium]|nr:Fe-S cluster assembly protein SufD [Candidatus Dormibacteraeota bacterium]
MTTDLAAPGLAVGREAVEGRVSVSTPALAARRRAAWDLYEELPPPDSRTDEDWRRTPLRGLTPEAYISDPGPTDHGAALVAALRALRDEIDPGAAFVASTRNGVRTVEGTALLEAQGVTVTSLDDAAGDHGVALARALALVDAQAARRDGHGAARWLALWNALWRGGVFVHVPAGVEARVPVVAAHSAGGDSPAIFPATVAVLEPRSSLTLVEVHASPAGDAPLLSDAVTALVLGDGARLDHCVLQRLGAGAWHMAVHRTSLGRDAQLRQFVATLGSRLQKVYVEALLDGQGSDARIGGVAFGAGTQHIDQQSLQAHRAPRTTSDLFLKVAVRDRATSVYSGLIDVAEGAQQMNGYVQNRNLMLSRGARATGIPRLEIRADDVRCSHGVTAGHVDDEQRFYLRSRGVAPEDADRIIVRGFMQDAVDRCPHAGFAETVGRLLDEAVDGAVLAGVAAAEPATPRGGTDGAP